MTIQKKNHLGDCINYISRDCEHSIINKNEPPTYTTEK